MEEIQSPAIKRDTRTTYKVFFPRFTITIKASSFRDAHIQAQEFYADPATNKNMLIIEMMKVRQVIICPIASKD